MTDYHVQVADGSDSEDAVTKQHVERFPYRVTAEHGIFKNGALHASGAEILLDPTTAARFIELGEVEEA